MHLLNALLGKAQSRLTVILLSWMGFFSVFSASEAYADNRPWRGTIRVRTESIRKVENNSDDGNYVRVTTEDRKIVTDTLIEIRSANRRKITISGTYSERNSILTEARKVCMNGTGGQGEELLTLRGQGQISLPEERYSGVSVSIEDDGSYTVLADGDGTAKGTLKHFKHHSWTDRCFGSFSRSNKTTMPWQWDFAPAVGKGTLDPDHPDQLEGSSEEVFDQDNLKVITRVQWSLSRKPRAKVVANAKAPASIVRGKIVTFDGSASTGPIREYRWVFVPGDGCPEGVKPSTIVGKKVSFVILCSLQAKLIVRGGDESEEQDEDSALVSVTPRKWETRFKVEAEQEDDQEIFADWMSFGKNRCAPDLAEPNHWIHKSTADWTWDKVGYKLRQIRSAKSPFDGLWYVASEDLLVHRVSLINSRLMPGGEVYEENKSKGNLANINTLLKQLRAHETLHSTLVSDRLEQRWVGDEDPAMKIEALIRKDEATLRSDADVQVAIVDGDLAEASAEWKIKEKLRKVSEFARSGKIFLRSRESGEYISVPIQSFADLGDE